nr:hypothetical protein [Atlantibacter sp.]
MKRGTLSPRDTIRFSGLPLVR